MSRLIAGLEVLMAELGLAFVFALLGIFALCGYAFIHLHAPLGLVGALLLAAVGYRAYDVGEVPAKEASDGRSEAGEREVLASIRERAEQYEQINAARAAFLLPDAQKAAVMGMARKGSEL